MFMDSGDVLEAGKWDPSASAVGAGVPTGSERTETRVLLPGTQGSVGTFKCSTYSFRSLDNNLPSVHAHKESTPREAELSRSHEGLNGLRNQQRICIKHSFGTLRIAPLAGTIFS